MSNLSRNGAAINEFRRLLKAELDDIGKIDKTIITKSAQDGVNFVKNITPIDTGHMRKSWRKSPTVQSSKGVSTSITNNADYAMYVNDGHRIVNKKGETVGFIKGRYLIEKTKKRVEADMKKLFGKEVQKIKAKYDS